MKEEEIEKAIMRFNRRMHIFIQEGLCEDGAYRLASQMYNRDLDKDDDRRVCFECEHYVGKNCMKIRDENGRRIMPLRFVLQRCDFFHLKGKK